ncbi:MAG TPA: ATP-dependent DNA helicase UvrD2 [Acidimicrobiales bacterium]|nr:ATP-dependent DNA helicase UvrD2 [Acidimicrobiales bacterium]
MPVLVSATDDNGVVLDPHLLGRSVVVAPGQAAPELWGGCKRVQVATTDVTTADLLCAAWRAREPLVIELAPGTGLEDCRRPPDEAITGLQPWEWEVGIDLLGERLHHALWANSVDARDGTMSYRWRDEALALGARADIPLGAAGGADVVLQDGTPAICDGGPLDARLSDRAATAVVHRFSIEHRSLLPLRDASPAGSALAGDQLAAVAEPGAGARVIAPAGSGKTRVLTERARLLLAGWRLPHESIALVAYNVRAANEMRSRLGDLPLLRTRTLNALALRLCGRRSTIEETEVRRTLGGLVEFPRKAETDPAAPWIEALSRVRLALSDPAEVEDEIGDVSDLDRVARAYRAELAQRDAADFDEQVTAAIERLLADPQFRRHSQRFARVLLVDEFQDLTPAHMLLLRLLSGPAGALFAVGDDDQTIYGYAGATPKWLVDFDRWFPGSASHSLEVNYRCPAPVVRAASNLLSHNSLRVAKAIRPAKPDGGGGLVLERGAGRPARATAAVVSRLMAGGAEPAHIAVLARVNASLVPVQVLLRQSGVPVDRAMDDRFLKRGGVRAALAWLAVAAAPAGSLPGAALREAARRPKRGLSQSLLDLVAKRRSVEGLTNLADWLADKGSSRESQKVLELVADVMRIRQAAARRSATTASVLTVVRTQVGDGGLDASANALDEWSHGAIAAHSDDIAALSELAELEPSPQRFGAWLADHLSTSSDEGGVTLASVHAVKGREWPHVVVHHATSGLLPHRLAWDKEEERRVFHVAITRCVESVTVVSGDPASPFLAEMQARAEMQPRAGMEAGVAGPAGDVKGSRPLRRSPPGQGPKPPKSAGPRAGHSSPAAGPEAEKRLRAWRSERARASGKPAYTVFDDRTLVALASAMPTNEVGLSRVPGIGPVKLEMYGSELIAIFEEVRAGAGKAPR